MKKLFPLTTFAIFILTVSPAFAIWSVSNEGAWSKEWPQELEQLRKQSRTLVGGLIDLRVHEIPFTDRDQFESAWLHILKVKTKGAPIILLPPNKKRFFGGFDAGVVVKQPPKGNGDHGEPRPGNQDPRTKWMYTTYIELVVDGKVVDLNRIKIPKDTPIFDERFE